MICFHAARCTSALGTVTPKKPLRGVCFNCWESFAHRPPRGKRLSALPTGRCPQRFSIGSSHAKEAAPRRVLQLLGELRSPPPQRETAVGPADRALPAALQHWEQQRQRSRSAACTAKVGRASLTAPGGKRLSALPTALIRTPLPSRDSVPQYTGKASSAAHHQTFAGCTAPRSGVPADPAGL